MATTFASGGDSSRCRQPLKISDRTQQEAAEWKDASCKVTPGGRTLWFSDTIHSHGGTVRLLIYSICSEVVKYSCCWWICSKKKTWLIKRLKIENRQLFNVLLQLQSFHWSKVLSTIIISELSRLTLRSLDYINSAILPLCSVYICVSSVSKLHRHSKVIHNITLRVVVIIHVNIIYCTTV